MHRLLSFIFILSASCAVAQTVGQYEVRKRTSTGFIAYGVTLSNGQALGQSGGIPAAINISGGSWGSITGTLSAQTDLQTALDAKQTASANLDTLSTGFGAIVVGSGLLKWVPGTGYALAGSVAVGDIGSMANNTLVGNVSGLSGNASALTATQVATIISAASDTLFGVSTNGFVKRSGANTYSIDTSTYLTANQTITLSGDITGSGSTAITTTLATVNSNVGSYGSASAVPVITVNAKGLITAVSTASITVPTAANPTASIGLTAVNGSASTFMRSDAALALDVSIAPTWSGAHAFSRAGAVSAPTISVTGTAYTGGTATTTKPLVLIEPTGTTSTAWSTSGTYLGLNAASTFAGRIIDVQQSQGGSSLSYFNVDSTRTTNVYHCYVTGSFYWGNSQANSLGTLSGTTARMTLLGDQLDIVQNNPQTVNIWGGNTGSNKKLSLSHNGTNGVITTTSGGVTITAAVTLGSGGTSASKVKHGTATLVAGVVTVSDTATVDTGTASTSSRIIINRMTDGGTVGDSYSITRTNGTSFTITSKTAGATQTLDTSTVSWLMINP